MFSRMTPFAALALLLAACGAPNPPSATGGQLVVIKSPEQLTREAVARESNVASTTTQTYVACERNLTLQDVIDGTAFDALRPVVTGLTRTDLLNANRARLRDRIPSNCFPFTPTDVTMLVPGERELVELSDGTRALLEIRQIRSANFYVAYARPITDREALLFIGF